MNRLKQVLVWFIAVVMFSACSFIKSPSKSEPKTSAPELKSTEIKPSPQTTTPPVQQGDLQIGEASGSYTAKGEVVELKYAYAGRGVRFGNESVIILVTDKPIPPDAIAEEIKSQTMLQNEQLRGLEYVIDKDGLWVRFHPGQYQESTNKPLKEYSVEGDVVRGVDDNSSDLSVGKYARSVKFVAAIVK